MNLDILKNIKNGIESNVSDFLDDLNDALTNSKASNTLENDVKKDQKISNENLDKAKNNRIEGHLYLVTEDRNNEIYLWDFTDKPKHEFKEIIDSEELASIAKEGTMLQYKNGKYELYSTDGYDMLYNEKK